MRSPSTSDCPNFSPSPSSACAVADRVALTFTGSILSTIETTDSNNVLNSVDTDDT
jgi:hypothetical protein